MNSVLFNRIIGVAGGLLVLCAYYLLWLSPDANLEEVIFRTRIAIVLNLFGAIFVIYYLYKR